jgi:hypothetical protein
MGNIITKDPDTIHWESNKNNSNQLTNDAQKLLGLLPDKLDVSSEKPTVLEPVKVSALHSNLTDPLGPIPSGLMDTNSSRSASVITSTELLGPRPSRQIGAPSELMDPKGSIQTGGNRMLDTADLSDTSPFISSDMYNNLIQTGGAKLTKGGAQLKNADADDSSTSSTSSSDDETNKKKNKNKKNNSDKTTDSVEVTEDSDNSNLSYVSSSAHTGGGSSSESGGESSESTVESDVSNDSNKSTEEKSTLNSPEISEVHNSNESTVPEINKSDESPEVMGYSANSPEPNEATPVSPPKKSKKKDAKKSKDDSSSSDSSSSDEVYKSTTKYINNLNTPIYYWWYYPYLYQTDSIYIPTFYSYITPYIELSLNI